MRANDVRSNDAIRHGAYVCLRTSAGARPAAAQAEVTRLVERLGFRNEFSPGDDHPADAIAFLRCIEARPADIADDALLRTDAIVHVASATAGPVTEFCTALERLLDPVIRPVVLGGVVRPAIYTGNAMHNFAYAHRVVQQPGTVMSDAFLVPLKKTSDWWTKDWMERHTYFLPRYDDAGRMVAEGHALAAAAGIPRLLRRTYRHPVEPAPPGAYDFVTYFECAHADVAMFHEVCAALRDVARNPEWTYVREGPTWHGRRVASWAELFA